MSDRMDVLMVLLLVSIIVSVVGLFGLSGIKNKECPIVEIPACPGYNLSCPVCPVVEEQECPVLETRDDVCDKEYNASNKCDRGLYGFEVCRDYEYAHMFSSGKCVCRPREC